MVIIDQTLTNNNNFLIKERMLKVEIVSDKTQLYHIDVLIFHMYLPYFHVWCRKSSESYNIWTVRINITKIFTSKNA